MDVTRSLLPLLVDGADNANEYLIGCILAVAFQTGGLTVSFLEPAQPSEVAQAMMNLMALNPQMSVLDPEASRNVCCVYSWSVVTEV